MDDKNLKHLKRQLIDQKKRHSNALENRYKAEREIALANLEIRQLEKKLSTIKKQAKRVIVSEHALLRYLERVWKIDMEQMQREILPSDIEKLILSTGGEGEFFTKTHRIKVKEFTVVTVMTD